MAKYHIFINFVAKEHCFGTKWGSTTFLVLELYKLEFLTVLEYSKLEFVEVLPPWHRLTWHLGLKKPLGTRVKSSSTVLALKSISIGKC